jgi:hypothetical protein
MRSTYGDWTVTGGRELAPAVAIDTFQRLHDAGQQEAAQLT